MRQRATPLAKLQSALAATRLHGIATNLDYLRQITASEALCWYRLDANARQRGCDIAGD